MGERRNGTPAGNLALLRREASPQTAFALYFVQTYLTVLSASMLHKARTLVAHFFFDFSSIEIFSTEYCGGRRNGASAENLALLRVEVKKGGSEVPEMRNIEADRRHGYKEGLQSHAKQGVEASRCSIF